MDEKREKINFIALWGQTTTADNDLDLILGAVKKLPVKYWRPNFLFKGALDSVLVGLSRNRFPAVPKKRGTHPVFALKPVGLSKIKHRFSASIPGFKVCPCTSLYHRKKIRWIKKGTTLMHTGVITDRRSYLLESIQFNMPASIAHKLTFQGEVPENAIMGNK